MANDAWGLLAYRQALVAQKRLGRWALKSASGLVDIGETTPYQNWLRRVCAHLEGQAPRLTPDSDAPPTVQALDASMLPKALAKNWQEWWPSTVQLIMMRTSDGAVNGLALFLFDQPLASAQASVLTRLAEVWQHAWALLSGRAKKTWRPGKKSALVLLLCAGAAMFIPVPQSVLAPAEIISLQSHVIASPVDGVVKEVLVRPNQAVALNQALFALDDTSLRNRREVLGKTLGSAQAELLATTQKAFDSSQSRADIAPLKGRVDERRAELAFVDEQLKRSVIYASRAGIAVFGDPNDWRGRPITAGERVLLIADPSDLGVLIHVPVADAIAIAPGAKLRLFLSIAPLKPLDAEVIETGYQAMLSPDNVASYRIRARLESSKEVQAELQRIGLKGTAKLLGPKVTLGYLISRRPIAALREWTGL
jgi:HlyD family secretion protein/Biotin-lipoyl like